MMPKDLLSIMLIGLVFLSNCGCVAALLVGGGAGAGTVAYLKGELKSTEEASIDRTGEAAQKAMEDLEFVVTSKEKDAFSAKLIAYRVNDKKIEINFQKASEKQLKLESVLEFLGTNRFPLMILERIRKRL